MILDNLKIIFGFFYRPLGAMSDAIDRGNWIFGVVGVLILAAVFQFTINAKINETYGVPQFNLAKYSQPNFQQKIPNTDQMDEDELYEAQYNAAYRNYQRDLQSRQKFPIIGDYGLRLFSFDSNFFTTLMSLALLYVPVTILLLSIFASIGGFGMVLRRDYGTLLACTLLAWTASHLPFAIAGLALNSQNVNPQIYLGLWLGSAVYFGVLMIFALRTVFGVNFGSAVATVCLSWLSMSAGTFIFRFISPFLFSPFLLIYAYMYFRGELGTVGNAYRQRQNFHRFLNNATLNPHDSDAHVQLGLIYKQRRQIAEALKHFQKAIEIEPTEIDANYELGKLARERGDFQEAINHFSIVVEQNDKHSLSEIWREIGATYLAANMLAEAHEALEKFVERRPFDPEGLYYLGQILKAQGETEKAREMFIRCIEAVQTSPNFRRYEQKKWAGLAKKQMV